RFDRRLITHFEWLLPLLAFAVSGLGAMTVYSATHVPGAHGLSPLALRQLLWLAGGSVAMLAALVFDYRRLERSAFVVYWFVLLGVVVAVAAPLAWPHLKVYQQKRILTFVHPEMDPRGAGYHVLQSKIAVGSGMMWGKGFLRGTQNQLNFLPEQHTDFIFS